LLFSRKNLPEAVLDGPTSQWSDRMAIDVRLDLVMVKKRISLTELSARIGISMTNLSLLKTGKVKGIRFSTLDALCRELDCRPGDILEYVPGTPGGPAISSTKEDLNER
jgi:putative transcriptional regulator